DSQRIRARHLLNRQRAQRSPFCTCFATVRARDEIELHDWIADLRTAGLEPLAPDTSLATIVRALARGERIEPWARHRRVEHAVREVVERRVEAARASTDLTQKAPKSARDPINRRFWRSLLTGNSRTTAKS